MPKDWRGWHDHYDNPESSISRRLELVQHDLRRAIAEVSKAGEGKVNLITMCSGEGRDVLPVLAEQLSGRSVHATLVECDEELARRARIAIRALSLSGVDVKVGDAGTMETYESIPLADILMICSVLGNIPSEDMQRTIAMIPALLVSEGMVIWTRAGRDKSLQVRTEFLEHGFDEVSFANTADDAFWVGTHRLRSKPTESTKYEGEARMFHFF